MTIPTDPTPEELQQMRETIAQADAKAAAEAAAARAAYLKPLTDLLNMPEYAAVKEAVDAIGGKYASEPFWPQLNCLQTGLRGLNGIV
ncbi:MAG: hypothetical protein CMN72_07685 [Sphingomonas sp.]|nr:hypothetical protein [Sphingomonas sp.]